MFWEPAQVFLKYAIAFILVGSAAFVIAIFVFVPDQTLRVLGPASLSLLALIAWYLLSRGMIEVAVHVQAYGFWAAVTAMAFFNGGVSGMSIIVYPHIIFLLGWLVGTRAAVAMTLLTVAATLGFALAESLGILPPPPPTPPAMRWIVQSLVFAYSVILIVYLVRSYQNRLTEVNELGSDLNRAQAVAHVGSWVYELATDVMRLSAETCRIFGLPEGTTGSHDTYLARVHSDDRARVDSAWQVALTGGAPFDNEHRILVGDTIRWIRQKAELEFRANGTALRGVGTTQDITERKQVEEALRGSEERFRNLLQNVPDVAVQGFGLDGTTQYWNRASERLYGYSAQEAIGKSLLELIIPPEMRDDARGAIAQMAGTGQAIPPAERSLMRKDGSRVAVHSSHALVQTPGHETELFCIDLDLTERKRAEAARAEIEAQLRESQKMESLGTLAGGVAHDFNNIVAAIIGNVELARQDVGPAHPALESLEEIRKASHRAKDLVQQILAFGRRQVLERKVISLAPVVQESARLLRSTLPAGVSLDVECAPDAPPVLADPTQIEQVLLNLCSNAWQAMQAQARTGEIEIRLATHIVDGAPYCGPERRTRGARIPLRPGRYACLTVRDHGPGMDQATRSRIFEPFFTTKPVGVGTGLGLAVVHGIVHEHDACIVVQSAPGEGASFRIYFPAAQPPGALAPAPEPDAAGESGGQALLLQGEGKHILYLDDDEAIVFLMTRLLQRRGYRVSGYTDAREALAAARAKPGAFDLVVTDYNMPGMSGLEVAQALKEIRSDLPVALASGYITEELRAKAPAAGVRELIYKPDTAEDFCQSVARLVNTLSA